jgi:hypothetical protein
MESLEELQSQRNIYYAAYLQASFDGDKDEAMRCAILYNKIIDKIKKFNNK